MEASRKIRLALVDDQVLVRAALAELFDTAEGMTVIASAGSLDEAIRLTEELRPELVLMDVLPQAGFFDGVARLLESCPGTRLVLIDDAPCEMNVREALRLGVAGYLTKHQPFAQVEAALHRAASGERVFSPEIQSRLVLAPDGVHLRADSRSHPLGSLTRRETDVLIHLAQGNSVKQCAKVLGIGASTVGNHKSRLMKKLDIHKTVELARLAVREGLITAGCAERQHSTANN